MVSPSEELELMRREEDEKRAFDEVLSSDPMRSAGGLSSRTSHPSRPFTRQSIDDLADAEYAASFEGESDDMLMVDRERIQEMENEKSRYMSMFYSSVRDLRRYDHALRSERNLFCGQGNFVASASSHVTVALITALTADPGKVDHLDPLLSSPTRVYQPYVSRLHRPMALQQLKMDEASSRGTELGRTKQHIEELDGHPLYGWEQILMLQVVFDLLDSERKGSITLSQLLKVTTHPEARSIVRFTLFGTYIKLRQEALFSFMFKDQRQGMESRVDLKTFIGGLKAVSTEKSVPARRIRLNDEHVTFCMRPESSKSRLAFNSLHRKAFLRRVLKAGDFVWALFFEGVMRFPAIIDSIGDDGTYTVKYLLSATKIKSHMDQPTTSSRIRVPLSDSDILPVLPLDEDGVLGYVFDDIDVEHTGKLNCQYILDQLKRERYQNVIKSSLALGTLVLDDHAPLNIKPENQKSFHLIALQLYYDKAGLSEGMLSRLDFVEIGTFIVDFVSFNVM